jgi:ribokinase
MIGCVGRDPEGRAYLDRLVARGVNTTGISTTGRQPTGTALIAVDGRGENQIVAFPGANFALTPKLVRAGKPQLAAASALLIQLEIPLPAVLESIRLARECGVPVILNPSPWRPEFPWGEGSLDYVVANEEEARSLLGFLPSSGSRRSALRTREELEGRRIGTLVVTRGARSTLCFSANFTAEIATMAVKPVDTVGAGDAFAGALGAAVAKGLPLDAAIRRANCAGALATLKRGAQESLPNERRVAAAARLLA